MQNYNLNILARGLFLLLAGTTVPLSASVLHDNISSCPASSSACNDLKSWLEFAAFLGALGIVNTALVFMSTLVETRTKAFAWVMWGIEAFTLACWMAGGIGLAWAVSQGVGGTAEQVQAGFLLAGVVVLGVAIATGKSRRKQGGVVRI